MSGDTYPKSYAAWERLLKPVTNALLRNQTPVVAELDGWKFTAEKSYRSRLYQGAGPAWFADIRAEKEGCFAISGPRDSVINTFQSMVRSGRTSDTIAEYKKLVPDWKGK